MDQAGSGGHIENGMALRDLHVREQRAPDDCWLGKRRTMRGEGLGDSRVSAWISPGIVSGWVGRA